MIKISILEIIIFHCLLQFSLTKTIKEIVRIRHFEHKNDDKILDIV